MSTGRLDYDDDDDDVDDDTDDNNNNSISNTYVRTYIALYMQQISKRYRVSVHCTVSFVTQTSTNVRATHVRTERSVPLLTSTDSPADVCRDSEENVAKQVIEAECRYNYIVITIL